ncbi:MAG: SusC/RagA family TonB-linked outer membrane protein [Bacteroidaceae bacterium]|nr:SusC/RagA family TonB-linked outer membrane protein [Bacteroidaceae bacterium]
MNKYIKILMLWAVAFFALPVSAQNTRISGTASDEFGGIPGIQVKELDSNNRIVSSTVTDANGNFTMVIKNAKNKLVFHGMGYQDKTYSPVNKTVYKVNMSESVKVMKEAVVTAKKKAPTTGLDIPAREYAGAVSSMKMDDLEGLAFESVDQALQGQIAGLDIVANSGNLGSGTTMRLRGTTTINGNAQPLIVVNDHIFELPDDAQTINFEDMDNEEQFSTLLNVNTEDIESITVLKDAASAAKWGVKGSNGVIEIKLRRGHRGPTRVNFSYKFTGTWQPDGYKMLDGDGYTMMQKEAFFNPTQRATAIPELDYNTELPYIYNHYSHNTDWLDAVKQFGKEHRYTLTLDGGGEKATFRVSAGYNKSTGSIIGQKLNQFTQSTTLDYNVSDRIQFRATMNMTFTNNHKNYEGEDGSGHMKRTILDRAYNAMPNMSIYEYDAMGNRTGNYFNMLPLAANFGHSSTGGMTNDGTKTSWELRDMFVNGNPVAYARLAWWEMKQYNLTPQFDITYKLWGKDNDHHQLNYKGDVQLNIFNTSDDKYVPSELHSMPWVWGGDNWASTTSNYRNEVSNNEYKSLEFTTRHELHYYSHFKNTNHSLSGMARFEMATGNSSTQNLGLWNVPNGITDPTVVALMRSASAGNNEWRSHSFFEQIHYSYKSKYSIDASVRTDGRTEFGRAHKYGTFPAFGARWNISDEKFMEPTRKIISMLAFRPTWGITGNTGRAGGNQYNRYYSAGYYNGHTVVRPANLSLPNLRWEKTQQWNLGFNLGLLDDLLTFEFEVYNKKTTDLLMEGLRIPEVNGFGSLAWFNGGTLRNKGWELNGSTAKFAKIGKFSMKLRGNISQNFNEVEEMDPLLLENLNGEDTWNPTNFAYQTRIQIHNAIGSIYGLKSKGVYRYDYNHNGFDNATWKAYGYAESVPDGVGGYRNSTSADEAAAYGNGYHYSQAADGSWYRDFAINTAAAAARRGENSTCPLAYDANGNLLTDAKGNPLPMYYCYSEGSRYQFQGGDAIYEDINHDGSIDRYDVVYLGNSNPKLYGGFGVNFYYGRFELNASFNFRMGNQILNLAKSHYESMIPITNQSYATTWRWRKNGDITDIPRALTGVNGYASYNSLVSDRYVENGDYLRLQYIQISYNFDPAKLKKIGIRTCKLFASINNVFCWTKYTGVDPEVSIGGFGIAKDESKTPRARSFTCSLNLGF